MPRGFHAARGHQIMDRALIQADSVRRVEARRESAARASAREDRAQLDPDVAIYREAKARRAARGQPELERMMNDRPHGRKGKV